MAGSTRSTKRPFSRAGIERVFEIDDMFDCAELLARQQVPRGDRLAIVTNAGGPGVMTTDALLDRDGELAPATNRSTVEASDRVLPAFWSHGNPIDVLGDAPSRSISPSAVRRLCWRIRTSTACWCIFAPQAMTSRLCRFGRCADRGDPQVETKPCARLLDGRSSAMRKAVESASTRRAFPPTPTARTGGAGVHVASSSTPAIRDVLFETPREIPVEFPLDAASLRRRVRRRSLSRKAARCSPRDDVEGAARAAYGIPVEQTVCRRQRADDAVSTARASRRLSLSCDEDSSRRRSRTRPTSAASC
jgi:acetyltransferase